MVPIMEQHFQRDFKQSHDINNNYSLPDKTFIDQMSSARWQEL